MTAYRTAESMRMNHEAFGRRHSFMMKAMLVWFFIVAAAAVTILVMFFTGNLNVSYSYNYQVGNHQYSETYKAN